MSVPRHIAIIMDGNGRWARRRLLPRNAGHAAGSETFRKLAYHCRDIGVQYLTCYAFSTENWKRPKDEIEGIFKLLDKYLDETLGKMIADNVKFRFIGDLSPLNDKILRKIEEAHRLSADFPADASQVNICLNYGGRDEIVRAVRRLIADPPAELTEETFAAALDTAGIPDPDLLIRTGGDLRISNFLLWELCYTELYFTNRFFPDFSPKELDKAIAETQKRQRRYGGL